MPQTKKHADNAARQRAWRGRKRNAADSIGTPFFQDELVTIYQGDSAKLLQSLPAGSVGLIVTSPPYNVGWDYGDGDGDGGASDRRPLGDYKKLLAAVLAGCSRALAVGGVLALNLPPSIRTTEYRAYPLAAWAQLHLLETDWLLREPLVWAKTQGDGEPYAATAAFGAQTNPYLRPTHELVLLASKGDYFPPGMTPKWQLDPYLPVLKDVWPLPAGRAKRGEPLAFPDELVRRLILLYGAPDTIVLDPFLGNGTTCRVARSLGRRSIGIELDPATCRRAAERCCQSRFSLEMVS